MNIKNLFKIVIVSGLLANTTTSCSDWLEVDLEDSILENKLFETNDGYTSVLNGVYAKMNEQYSTTLSMGTIDAMAKLYDIGSNHNQYPYYNFDFDGPSFRSMSGNVWTGLYSLIANLNTLLEFCDSPESTLKEHYYPYVKGEALALRAMLHFDLLRIYGPIYSEGTLNTICIPYQETSSKEIQPLLSAEKVMEKIIRDLKAASELLKDDRIRTEGVLNSEPEDLNEGVDFRYRQFRLNYYAVQGLLARAYLWKGDKTAAYECAKAIITECETNEVFPWTAKAKVQGDNPDLLFSTEVMFSLYNVSRLNLYDSYFNPNASYTNALTFAGKTMAEGDMTTKINWFYDDMNDLRLSEMWSVETIEEVDNVGGTTMHTALCFKKYDDIYVSETRRYMIPLLRMSEIYLIAAECATDLTEAIGYINTIRSNRNCVNLELTDFDTQETIQTYIGNEFARETIGEGQLYFYYKRLGKTSVLSGSAGDYEYAGWYGAEVSMSLQNYVWPLPPVEEDKRAN
ncbi:MAG: RagB/SusD family nutrient uptake outer membrane protein [Bacteroidaceae bacterium]|nr:RagB/SusD family nutrient uptake outer membrane protein [Bacteroidaceae bacterium]